MRFPHEWFRRLVLSLGLLMFLGTLASCGSSKGSSSAPEIDGAVRLASLSLSTGKLDQVFQPTVRDYTATVVPFTSTIQVRAVAEDPDATVTVNGSVVIPGEASNKITIDTGSKTISVVINADNGAIRATYNIEITRQSAGNLAQRAYIKASNTDAGDRFSYARSIALFGNTLVVGTPFEDSAAVGVDADQGDNSAEDSGAVYVFVRDVAGVWSQQAYIKASNAEAGDWFGASVTLFEDTLVVGAPREASAASGINGDQADNSAAIAGAVYVFVRDAASAWSQQAYIKASNTDAFDGFGGSVSVSEGLLAVGAPGEGSAVFGVNGDQSDNSAPYAGAVYVFSRDASDVWSQQAYIKASNTDGMWGGIPDGFGANIALSGETLAVGAPGEDSGSAGVDGDQGNSGADVGAVYVFTRDAAGAWSQQAYVKPSVIASTQPLFGAALALDRDTLAVGAIGEDSAALGIGGDQSDFSAPEAGAVYLFRRDNAGFWSEQAYIKASNTDAGDQFGGSVAVAGDVLAVGAAWEDSSAAGVNGNQNDENAEDSGAAYVFTRDAAGVWSQLAYIKTSAPDAGDVFGDAIALSHTLLVVGAQSEDGFSVGIEGDQSNNSVAESGAVYVFE